MSSDRIIGVYGDWYGGDPVRLGTLRFQYGRGKEVTSFSWDGDFLHRAVPPYLDPDLAPYPGEQFRLQGLFGMFQDASPDSWGRKLVNRKEVWQAQREKRQVRALTEADYLLQIYDRTRIGGLRFREDENGEFMNPDSIEAAPPWARLRELQESARQFEEDADDFDERWLAMLFAPGSSLGGARPKANVTDEAGDLWIAKFPAKNDEHDVGAWEYVVHEVAVRAGLDVPAARHERFSEAGTTFLCRRFDRRGERRVHYASAMTMLGCVDRQEELNGTYVDLAGFIIAHSAQPERDLHELWRRIVFSVMVSNTDDHLRNHGFLLTETGWKLSPAFDLNANARRSRQALSLEMEDGVPILSVDDALRFSDYFRYPRAVAENVVREVAEAVSSWRRIAESLGISRSEIIQYEPCFKSFG